VSSPPSKVTDVADAVIMASLFGELWTQGVVMVATSNRAPDELYLDGLNRPYFLPFIALLQRQCLVVDMDSGVDHRTKFRSVLGDSYFTPLDGCVPCWGPYLRCPS
jgi:predicted ATPase